MTTKTVIGLAAVGFILYEFWKREQAQAAGPSEYIQTDNMSPVPTWAQQLSATGGTTTETSILTDLMSIPQGPGGTASPGGAANFFAGAECILPPLGL